MMPKAPRKESPQLLFALLKLAELGAHRGFVRAPTEKVGGLLGLSQQSASRILRILEQRGWIERSVSRNGVYARITNSGFEKFAELQGTISRIFGRGVEPIAFRGIVFTGIGDGAYYMRLYRRTFKSKVGFEPFPGTLNLRAATIEDLKALERIRSLPAIEIRGFRGRQRSFGSVRCYRVIVQHSVPGFMVVPERTHYGREVAELITSERLREKLGLRDGDMVTVEATFEESPLPGASCTKGSSGRARRGPP